MTEDEVWEALLGGSKLVLKEDRFLVPDPLFIAMAQMKPCSLTHADRVCGPHKSRPLGFKGICCKHCLGIQTLGHQNMKRRFPGTVRSLAQTTTSQTILRHFTDQCRSCPVHIRQTLLGCRLREALRVIHVGDNKAKPVRGSRKVFFDRIWDRLHAITSCEDDHPQRHGGAPSMMAATMNLSQLRQQTTSKSLDDARMIANEKGQELPKQVAEIKQTSSDLENDQVVQERECDKSSEDVPACPPPQHGDDAPSMDAMSSEDHLYQTTPSTILDDERAVAAEQAPVTELPRRATEIKQTPSDLENDQVGQDKEREPNPENQMFDLEKQVEQEKANSKDMVTSLQVKLGQNEKPLEGSDRGLLHSLLLSNTSIALKAIFKSLTDRMSKVTMHEHSVSQRILRLVLAKDDKSDDVKDLASTGDLKANGQDRAQSTRSIGEVQSPSEESIRKRARVTP